MESFDALAAVLHFNLLSFNDWTCRVSYFIIDGARCVSAWLLVGISVERCIGITFPYKALSMCTIAKGKLYLICITIIFFGLSAPCLGFYNTWPDVNDAYPGGYIYYCIRDRASDPGLRYFASHLYSWVQFVSYSAVPFLLLFFINIIIIFKLVQAQRVRKTMQQDTVTSGGGNMMGMTAMLISISIAFLVLTFPWCLYMLLASGIDLNDPKQYIFFVHLDPLWALSHALAITNHGCNFYLYCVSGSRFRKDGLFCKK